MHDSSVNRRTFLRSTTVSAVAAAVGFPAIVRSRGSAAETLKIGLLEELTGVPSGLAIRNSRGAKMALEAWNQRGGVMGRQVEAVEEDCQTNPGVTVTKVRKLVNQDHVVALMGTVNSADTLAASATANSFGKVFIDPGAHSDQIVGKSCHWNTFMTCHNTWQMTHATGFSIAKKLSKNRWYFVTPDFAYGHDVVHGYEDVIKRIGGSIAGNALIPLGTSEYSSYITRIQSASPGVLIVLLFGSDLVNFLKQARAFGLLAKVAVAGPLLFYEDAWAMAPEDRVGYWGVDWYYKSDSVLGSNNTLARDFISAYTKRFNEPPSDYSCTGYVSMDRLLWAIDKAKSTDSVKIARTLEGAEFQSLWAGTTHYSRVNHRLIWPAWFGELHSHGTADDPYDILTIIDRQPPHEETAAELAARGQACNLGFP
jgi:branched-chain amino acid transport system substrate-binding protein